MKFEGDSDIKYVVTCIKIALDKNQKKIRI